MRSFRDEIDAIRADLKSPIITSPQILANAKEQVDKQYVPQYCEGIKSKITQAVRIKQISYDCKTTFWGKKIDSNPHYTVREPIAFLFEKKTTFACRRLSFDYGDPDYGYESSISHLGIVTNSSDVVIYAIESIVDVLASDEIYSTKKSSNHNNDCTSITITPSSEMISSFNSYFSFSDTTIFPKPPQLVYLEFSFFL